MPKPKAPAKVSAPAPAAPIVRDDGVEVVDPVQATRLYQKGFIGEPRPGNLLRLSLVEAAWLCTQGRLELPGGAAGLLARGAAQGNRTEVAFLAYSDLRARGLVARHAEGGFLVWPRGDGPPKPHAYMVQVAAEGDAVDGAALSAAAQSSSILAVVDEDGAVTHYKVEQEAPAGSCPPGPLPKAKGVLLADRVLVADADAAQAYAQKEFLGTPSPAGLVLSIVEAAALQARGVLAVPGLDKRARTAHGLAAYTALRDAGVVVKSGFRFGTHLRGYAGDPEEGHALWLVQCLDEDEALHWSALSRAIRLAHGVRKRFLVAIGAQPMFVALTWFKP
ncbi:MAG: tRNA-intron endonuclease, archaea type [Thermoplasmata archaeon]|jgi:tRNA-intron endonuclease|nr:tRNA-intron endonuclease, archaea type [Thermoplasmata archaeon]